MTADPARLGRKAENSTLLDHAVRLGLVVYGVEHLLIAWLAGNLALGDRSGSVSSKGALKELASTGLGRTSLYVVAAGFAALVVWQALQAAFGHRRDDGFTLARKRVASAGKAVFYGVLGFGALRLATGSSASGKSTDTWSAKLMAQPYGAALVAVVGLVILSVAVGFLFLGWTEKFRDHLGPGATAGKDGSAYVLFGKVGYLSKGVAIGVVGGLFLWAAWTHDPQKSGGLDQALSRVLHQPFGPVLLGLIALGIACYGLFCFAWARHLDH
jgi:hypothetical protein